MAETGDEPAEAAVDELAEVVGVTEVVTSPSGIVEVVPPPGSAAVVVVPQPLLPVAVGE